MQKITDRLEMKIELKLDLIEKITQLLTMIETLEIQKFIDMEKLTKYLEDILQRSIGNEDTQRTPQI